MRKRLTSVRFGFVATGFLATAVPVVAQETGGRSLELSLTQGVEAVRNPNLDPGADESGLIATTDLSFGFTTKTRRSSLSLNLASRLRAASSDITDDTLEIDQPRISVAYSHTAPGTRLDASFSLRRQNLEFLRAVDLLESEDGTLFLPDDLAELRGEGIRTSATYRLSAQFGENRPFGFGFSLSGTDLSYKGVTSSTLEDNRTTNLGLSTRFDLSPVLRLTSRLGYSEREGQTTDAVSATSFDFGLALARPAESELRTQLTIADLEEGDNRISLSAGTTQTLGRQSVLDFDVGATFIDSRDTELTGRLSYTRAVTPKIGVNTELSRLISSSVSNETVLSSAAQIGFNITLSKQSAFSIAASYAEQETLGTNDDVTEVTVSMQVDRSLTKDWTLSLGASQTRRDEAGVDKATSERLFLSIGRTWKARY